MANGIHFADIFSVDDFIQVASQAYPVVRSWVSGLGRCSSGNVVNGKPSRPSDLSYP